MALRAWFAILIVVFFFNDETVASAEQTTLVSWYTPSYAERARRLENSCEEHSVRCDIVPVPETTVAQAGSFQNFKVLFMLAKLLEHGNGHGGGIVYADADILLNAPLHQALVEQLSVRQPSALPHEADAARPQHRLPDAAFFNWRMSKPDMPPTLATGVVYLRDTQCTRALLRLWLGAMNFGNNSLGAADDRVLSFLFESLDLQPHRDRSETKQAMHGTTPGRGWQHSFHAGENFGFTAGPSGLLAGLGCSFTWLPPAFLHLPAVPAFTNVFGHAVVPVLSHPDPITASFRNSKPPLRPPRDHYELFRSAGTMSEGGRLGSVHRERTLAANDALKLTVQRLAKSIALAAPAYDAPPPVGSDDALSQVPALDSHAHKLSQGMRMVQSFLDRQGRGGWAERATRAVEGTDSKAATARFSGSDAVSPHSTLSSDQNRAKLFLMFDISPQEQFGKALRAVSVVISEVTAFAASITSSTPNTRNPFPGGIVVVLPRVRCLHPLRYLPFSDLVDLEFMNSALRRVDGARSAAPHADNGEAVQVMQLEDFVAKYNPKRVIPILHRFESQRYKTRCEDAFLATASSGQEFGGIGNFSAGSCEGLPETQPRQVGKLLQRAAAGEPQFALPGQPHSLVAFDGATFQDQLNRGLVDLNALQLSERVQSAGRNFHSQVLWPALSGGAASDKAADNAQVQLHSLSRVLAVHWRRNDFVSLRSSQHGVLLAPSELVAAIRAALEQYDLDFVYLATDSTESNALSQIRAELGSTLLPQYKGSASTSGGADEDEDRQVSAAVEAWICSRATVFKGTRTSNFSLLIQTLRLVQRQAHSGDGDLTAATPPTQLGSTKPHQKPKGRGKLANGRGKAAKRSRRDEL